MRCSPFDFSDFYNSPGYPGYGYYGYQPVCLRFNLQKIVKFKEATKKYVLKYFILQAVQGRTIRITGNRDLRIVSALSRTIRGSPPISNLSVKTELFKADKYYCQVIGYVPNPEVQAEQMLE